MIYKIGDRVTIRDGSFSIEIKNDQYSTRGVSGSDKVTGIVKAVDCRLPIGPSCLGEDPTPCEGMPIASYKRLFNDLLIQTKTGFVFTSSRCVERTPEEYKIVIYGVEIDVTKEQSEKLAKVIGTKPGSGVYRTS